MISIKNKGSINKNAEKFVTEEKSHNKNIGIENRYNYQSAFQLESHSGSTLTLEGM